MRIVERRRESILGIRNGMQRGRCAHQFEDLLADAVHIDGERNPAKTDQRDAKLLLAHWSSLYAPGNGSMMSTKFAMEKRFVTSITPSRWPRRCAQAGSLPFPA